MNDFQCKILSSQRGEKDEWVVALWGGGGSGKVRSLRRGAWSLEVLVSKIAWGITVTLTELGVAAKAWIGGERLGSWPKVRLRVSEIVICEWESKTRENRENRGELCELWGWGKEILGFITLYIYIYISMLSSTARNPISSQSTQPHAHPNALLAQRDFTALA